MELDINLSQTNDRWFHVSISLCGQRGYELVESFPDLETAQNNKKMLDSLGCGRNCNNQHYAFSLPRGHIRNIQDRRGIEQSAYLRWLVCIITEKQNRLARIA